MDRCNHISKDDDHRPLVELCVIAEQPGKVLFALKCQTCGSVLDQKWFPDQMRCVLLRREV